MRQGKMMEAQQAAPQMTENPMWMRGLVEACLAKAPAADIHRMAEQAENELLAKQNPEMKYHQGTLLAACGEKQISFAFLRQAVAGNYCAHQALQSDPLLASVRGDAEFHQIVEAAADCQKKFAAARGRSKAGWGLPHLAMLHPFHDLHTSERELHFAANCILASLGYKIEKIERCLGYLFAPFVE